MPFTELQKYELAQPVPAAHVKLNHGGKRYIEAWYAQQRANEIFGVDGWSMESTAQLVAQSDNVDKDTGEVTGRKAAYVAQVKLTFGHGPEAVVRGDTGYCVGYGPDDCEAGDMASKGATSDAMKRALKGLGPAFGSYFYDKSGKVPEPPANGHAVEVEAKPQRTGPMDAPAQTAFKKYAAKCRAWNATKFEAICADLRLEPHNISTYEDASRLRAAVNRAA